MSTVDVTSDSHHSDGYFSKYYRVTKTVGIKVLCGNEHYTYSTIKKLKKSYSWWKATTELETLKKAHKIYPNCPKPYKVVPVKMRLLCGTRHYAAGIMMEHITGKRLDKVKMPRGKKTGIILAIRYDLERNGIIHNDLYARNIIKSRNGYVPLDFDKRFIYFLRVKR